MKKWIAGGLALILASSMAFTAVAGEAAKKMTSDAAIELAEAIVDAAQGAVINAGEAADGHDFEYEVEFPEWNEGAPALETLIDYVDTVTDPESEDYIPVDDRIAVFDMDGTIYGELFPTYLEYYMLAWRILKDPSITPDAEMLEVGRTLRDCALDNSFPEDMPMQHAIQAARAYAGLTINEFADFVTEILLREADGFEGMTYGEAFYEPILEVITYLQEHAFNVYVVSGSDRFICRTLFEGMADIPFENFIGMDVQLEASGQNGEDGLNYVFTAEDDVIRTDKLLIKNLKTNKVLNIVQEIGHQPVLSFGNSSGDVSMHMYTISKNVYKSAAFMLIADDEERDYGNTEKAEGLREKWEASGFNVISMKNDWKTIYGEDVKKTGTFHWAEELADDRGDGAAAAESAVENNQSSQEAAAAEENQEAGAEVEAEADADAQDVQYVMYVGTNDKDTNEQLHTDEECRKIAGDILIDHLGGYTMQEAHGGWINDNGEECQEYTLVIYMSDTTEEQVHAVADEMVKAFNQNSVLIQTNPTQTEFYSGN